MQVAYQLEAKGMESLKKQAPSPCNKRTNLHGPTNQTVTCNAV